MLAMIEDADGDPHRRWIATYGDWPCVEMVWDDAIAAPRRFVWQVNTTWRGWRGELRLTPWTVTAVLRCSAVRDLDWETRYKAEIVVKLPRIEGVEAIRVSGISGARWTYNGGGAWLCDSTWSRFPERVPAEGVVRTFAAQWLRCAFAAQW